MVRDEMKQLLQTGMAETEKGNLMIALVHLENAARLGKSPLLASYLGFCLAAERRQFKKGVALCNEALQAEPEQPLHHLNLGRIYLAAGQKALALKALRKGLRYGHDRRIVELIKELGIRQQPVFATLPRQHPLNRLFGKIFTRLGLR